MRRVRLKFPSKEEETIQAQIDRLRGKLKTVRRNREWKCPHCKTAVKVKNTICSVVLSYGYDYSQDGGGSYWYEAKNPDFWVKCSKCEKDTNIREILHPGVYGFFKQYRYEMEQGDPVYDKAWGN